MTTLGDQNKFLDIVKFSETKINGQNSLKTGCYVVWFKSTEYVFFSEKIKQFSKSINSTKHL